MTGIDDLRAAAQNAEQAELDRQLAAAADARQPEIDQAEAQASAAAEQLLDVQRQLAEEKAAAEEYRRTHTVADPVRLWTLGATTEGSGTVSRDKFLALNKLVGGVLTARHTFSGDKIPADYATASETRYDIGLGVRSIVNVKSPGGDVAGAAAGKYDAQFKTYLDSWFGEITATPTSLALYAGGPGYFTIDHEADNPSKGVNPADYRTAQVRYARMFLAHPISKYVRFTQVLMGFCFQPESGRNPADWDAMAGLTDAERAKVCFGLDIYFKAEKTAQANWDTYAKPGFDWAAAHGYPRTAVFETAINNDKAAASAALLADLGARYRAVKSLEMAAWYDSTGKAAGVSPYITAATAPALASWSLIG